MYTGRACPGQLSLSAAQLSAGSYRCLARVRVADGVSPNERR